MKIVSKITKLYKIIRIISKKTPKPSPKCSFLKGSELVTNIVKINCFQQILWMSTLKETKFQKGTVDRRVLQVEKRVLREAKQVVVKFQ